uniref:Uncharacterized protein n=1 Tax=Rhodnius prolixus TaxID=13249 RepID=T1HAR8_RHOPR
MARALIMVTISHTVVFETLDVQSYGWIAELAAQSIKLNQSSLPPASFQDLTKRARWIILPVHKDGKATNERWFNAMIVGAIRTHGREDRVKRPFLHHRTHGREDRVKRPFLHHRTHGREDRVKRPFLHHRTHGREDRVKRPFLHHRTHGREDRVKRPFLHHRTHGREDRVKRPFLHHRTHGREDRVKRPFLHHRTHGREDRVKRPFLHHRTHGREDRVKRPFLHHRTHGREDRVKRPFLHHRTHGREDRVKRPFLHHRTHGREDRVKRPFLHHRTHGREDRVKRPFLHHRTHGREDSSDTVAEFPSFFQAQFTQQKEFSRKLKINVKNPLKLTLQELLLLLAKSTCCTQLDYTGNSNEGLTGVLGLFLKAVDIWTIIMIFLVRGVSKDVSEHIFGYTTMCRNTSLDTPRCVGTHLWIHHEQKKS